MASLSMDILGSPELEIKTREERREMSLHDSHLSRWGGVAPKQGRGKQGK